MISILYNFRYESKNHECTISAVEHLIETKKIQLDMKDVAFIRTTEQMNTKLKNQYTYICGIYTGYR